MLIPMRRLPILLLCVALAGCAGDEPAEEVATPTETASETAPETGSTGGYVENVTRAQKKAGEIAAEETKRAEEVDEAMKDQ